MATVPQTFSSLTAEKRDAFYIKALLIRALPNLVHAQFGQKARSISIPRNQGDTVNFRKFASLPAVTTPLTEGVPPVPNSASVSAITATVAQYGAFILYSDLLDMMSIDPVLTQYAQLLGEQAGITIDQLVRAVLVASGTEQLVNGRANHAAVLSTDIINAKEVMQSLATLEAANARPFENGRYAGIIHPNSKFDLLNDSTIQNMMVYAPDSAKNGLWTYKLGECLGVDWYVSSQANRTADGYGSINVYDTLILGRDAYGTGGLASQMFGSAPSSKDEPNTGKSVSPVSLIQKEIGSGGTDDPLDQKASIGWKTTFVAKVLNADFYVRLQHACSLG